MDGFQIALTGKTTTMYEYFLVGSVLDTAKDGFVEIVRGLCDNPEQRPVEFVETEQIFSATNNKGTMTTLRARSVRNPTAVAPTDHTHCHLRYLGQLDLKLDRERKAMVRSYMDCLTSANLNEYLQSIGMNMDMEIILKGQLFHKGRLKVSVSKMFTLNAATGGEPQPVSASHLVEVSCVVSATQASEAVAEDVKRFADLFKPYVKMEKTHQIMEELKI